MRNLLTVFSLLFATSLLAQERTDRTDQPFANLFRLPGITFTAGQEERVQEVRNRMAPKLQEQQRQLNAVYTVEQRQARREALEAAREAGKNQAEAQQAVDAAVRLTDDQQQQIAAIQKARAGLVAQIQTELRGLLTPEQRSQLSNLTADRSTQRPGNNGLRPTHANVKYGPADRNVMDIWLAESDTPTPVLVSIHGGGFRGGNKSVSGGVLRESLESGISVVAITYRLSEQAIAPAQFHDSARAIQFIRHNAKDWNIDPTRIAATGGSAGAGLSLWLGFHDDLADPDSDDPVLRQSSRLSCMAVYNGQTSYDPRYLRTLFPENDTYQHPALVQLFDADLSQLQSLPPEKYALFEEVSALPHLTADDAPALLIYGTTMETPISSQGVGIHHPRFGMVLKEQMDSLGVECQVHTGVGRNDDAWTSLTMEFVKKHLLTPE